MFMSEQLEVMCLCQHNWKCGVCVSTTGSVVFVSAQLEVWCSCQHDWKCAVRILCVNYYLCVWGDNRYLCVWGDNFTCVYGVTIIHNMHVCMG